MKKKYSDVRKWAQAVYFGRPSIRPEDWDDDKRDMSRYAVYNHLASFPVDPNAKPTTETRRQADALFEGLRPRLSGYKLPDKQTSFQLLFHAAKRAMHSKGCVRYSRDTGPGKRIHLQVIEAAIADGLFLEHRSPPGSPKMSRLLPLHPIEEHACRDPWEFDPNQMKQFVYLRQRHTEKELPVDWALHIAYETQARFQSSCFSPRVPPNPQRDYGEDDEDYACKSFGNDSRRLRDGAHRVAFPFSPVQLALARIKRI